MKYEKELALQLQKFCHNRSLRLLGEDLPDVEGIEVCTLFYAVIKWNSIPMVFSIIFSFSLSADSPFAA
jgi:hypothetical protein